MKDRRLWVVLPVLLLSGLLAVFLGKLERNGPDALPSALVGKPAPRFDLAGFSPDHPGLATSDLRQGSVTLVNVFASWCVPCLAEMPQLKELSEKHGVTIHALAYKDQPEKLAAVFAKYGNPFTRIGMDNDGRAAIEWGITGVPETYIIDGQGRIVYRHIGNIASGQVGQILQIIQNAKS